MTINIGSGVTPASMNATNAITLTTTQATDYSSATVSATVRGRKFLTLFPTTPSGNDVVAVASPAVAVVNQSGTVGYWAAVDSTTFKFLASGPLTASLALTMGQTVDVSGFTLTIASGVGSATPVTATQSIASLVKVSGDDQGGTVGLAQAAPMVAQVLDGSGNPAVGVTVNWTTSAGSLSAASSTTGSDGKASVTLTHASTPQKTTVTATASTFSTTFTQTGHIPLYGTHSAFPTLLKPLSVADPLAGGGFIPDDGLSYILVSGASDEFTGTTLDTTKWWTRHKDNTGTLDHYNSELQRYNNNHVLSNGTLKITAAPKVPAQTFTAPNAAVFPLYDSQMIRSRTLVKYGYIECRAKQPPGVGMWPAFWVLPQSTPHPELDIMDDAKNGTHEFWNMSHSAMLNGSNRIVWSDTNKNNQFNFWLAPSSLSATYFSDDFHVWSLLWDPTTVTSYIDGQPVTQWRLNWKNDSGVDPGGASVIANLAVGDGWATDNWTVQPTTTPQTFEIDYIRVYQRADIAFTAVSAI